MNASQAEGGTQHWCAFTGHLLNRGENVLCGACVLRVLCCSEFVFASHVSAAMLCILLKHVFDSLSISFQH